MRALRQRKHKLDGKTLCHHNSLDDEQLVGGKVSDDKPPIRQLLEGIEWYDNVLVTTSASRARDTWRMIVAPAVYSSLMSS